MTEQDAIAILGDINFYPDGSLSMGGVVWFKGDREADIGGRFTADELEALAWVMRNYK
jgi:hypothetical protein